MMRVELSTVDGENTTCEFESINKDSSGLDGTTPEGKEKKRWVIVGSTVVAVVEVDVSTSIRPQRRILPITYYYYCNYTHVINYYYTQSTTTLLVLFVLVVFFCFAF